jgi:hypothetical protein
LVDIVSPIASMSTQGEMHQPQPGCASPAWSALYPLSEDGVAIDYVLGAANYRPLLENEELMARLIRTKWL